MYRTENKTFYAFPFFVVPHLSLLIFTQCFTRQDFPAAIEVVRLSSKLFVMASFCKEYREFKHNAVFTSNQFFPCDKVGDLGGK